jgi:hypothetical protein
MINGFDVPKLYVADLALLPKVLRTPDKTLAVIDGRQRFEALFEWFSGDLTLNDDFVLLDEPLLQAQGFDSPRLQAWFPQLAQRVEDFALTVMDVITDNQDEINQLFIRLNQNQPLTGAETRNAMSGNAPAVLRRLAEHEFFTDRIRFSVKRGGDLNTAAKLLLIEFTGKFADVKKRRLDSFVKQIADQVDLAQASPEALELTEHAAGKVLDAMCLVFHHHDLLLTQGQIPVYYWLVRDVGPNPMLRDYLVDFERRREENRQLAGDVGSTGAIDREMLQYDQFNRSVNDEHSLRGRYEILRRGFG